MSSKKKKKKPPKRKRLAKRADYEYHLPALLDEAIEALNVKPEGIYIDGTLGGGGHTEAILEKLNENGRVYGFDKDETAISYCRDKFKGELDKGPKSRLVLYNECFSEACGIVANRGRIDGVLMDLGMSSRQLNESRRGFSFRSEAPLDMRFASSGKSAKDILRAADEEELERLLAKYGEEPFAGAIARRLIERRRAFDVSTTFDLRTIIEESVPKSAANKSAARVFQALRIAVNDELKALENALNNCLQLVSPKSRIVVISYHSLEDRIVKNVFKERASKSPKLSIKETKRAPNLRVLTPKPITPSYKEISRNPRSKSAKLRVAEKI